jgi:hypothetical protein
MRHRADSSFWKHYRVLPQEVRAQADRAFKVLKTNASHPSLHFKKVGPYWSARVNLYYRALAIETSDGYTWFWIGTHDQYERRLP